MARDLKSEHNNSGSELLKGEGSPKVQTGSQQLTAESSPKKQENDFPFSVMVGDVYEGPLDLLLDLIRKQDIDIYDIPIARITAQYLTYVEKLRELDVNVAA